MAMTGMKRGFRPALADRLENRVVLSHGVHRNLSVLVAGLTPHATSLVRNAHRESIIALINQAFNSFSQDYTQARATYLSGLPSPSADATAAFKNYTTYRVNLLGQQLTSVALQTSQVNAKQHGSGASLPAMIARRVDGVDNKGVFQPNTLGSALINTIPPNNSTPSDISLDSLAQDQAIQATQVAVVNGFNIVKNNDFGNKPAHS
jgi:hypothetical protein